MSDVVNVVMFDVVEKSRQIIMLPNRGPLEVHGG